MLTTTTVSSGRLKVTLKTYEDKPGEMTAFNLEQEDWSLKVWSNWRESIWLLPWDSSNTKKERYGLYAPDDLL